MKIALKIFLLAVLFILGSVNSALAEKTGSDTTKCEAGQVCLDNPLRASSDSSDPSLQQLIGRIIKGGLGVVGSITLAIFIYGGFRWMTSAGNPEGVQKGKETLLYATLGLIIIFSAYALVTFVLQNLLGVG